MKFDISDNPTAGRYEGRIEGELAGYCDYVREGGRVILPHTETLPAYRGRGVAESIVAFAVEDLEKRKLAIVPRCWFVEDFMQRRASAGARRPRAVEGPR